MAVTKLTTQVLLETAEPSRRRLRVLSLDSILAGKPVQTSSWRSGLPIDRCSRTEALLRALSSRRRGGRVGRLSRLASPEGVVWRAQNLCPKALDCSRLQQTMNSQCPLSRLSQSPSACVSWLRPKSLKGSCLALRCLGVPKVTLATLPARGPMWRVLRREQQCAELVRPRRKMRRRSGALSRARAEAWLRASFGCDRGR
jgi:hypothetical protein